jgi:hypothetical protein
MSTVSDEQSPVACTNCDTEFYVAKTHFSANPRSRSLTHDGLCNACAKAEIKKAADLANRPFSELLREAFDQSPIIPRVTPDLSPEERSEETAEAVEAMTKDMLS